MVDADVAVIGAGVAGLACARALSSHGLNVRILEARDRIGGRIRTLRLPAEDPIELGAQVIHGIHAPTWSIVHEGGLRTTALRPARLMFRLADAIIDVRQLVAAGGVPPWSLEQSLARESSPDRGIKQALLARCGDRIDCLIAMAWIPHRWGGSPETLSEAGMAWIRRRWGSGEGEFVIVDGYDRVPAILAAGLDVRLLWPVSGVGWSSGSVSVSGDQGSVTARAAVVAVPPTVVAAGALRFDPPLPRTKRRAAEEIDLGDAIVVVAMTGEPAPWSAYALVVGQPGGFWRARAGSRAVTGWFRAGDPSALRTIGIDRGLVDRLLGRAFPWIDEGAIDELLVTDWGADPFTLGAYSYPSVGGAAKPGRWASPLLGSLFFAGEAACTNGHLGLAQGALESGYRAARQVLHALSEDGSRSSTTIL